MKFLSIKALISGFSSIAISIILLFGTAPNGFAEDDLEYWSEYKFSVPLASGDEVFYNPQFRIRDDISDFFYHEHRLGYSYKQWKNLGVGVHYLFGRTEPSKGPWKNENRAELDLTPKWSWGDYNFSVRGRAELRHIEGSSGDPLEWRFRLKPGISTEMEVLGHTIYPYITDDVFYDAEKGVWNQNRVYVGFSAPLGKICGKSLTGDVYYLFKSNRSTAGDWSSTSVIGTKLGVKF
jgi:hypothetical protein